MLSKQFLVENFVHS